MDALRTYTVKYGKYFYDDQLDLTSDNVQWIAGFQVKKFVQSRFWPIVKKVASFVSGEIVKFVIFLRINQKVVIYPFSSFLKVKIPGIHMILPVI